MRCPMSIKWHHECVENMKGYHDRLKNELDELMSKLDSLDEEIEFYELQIEEAIKQGKDKFDRGSFLKNKRPKGV